LTKILTYILVVTVIGRRVTKSQRSIER